MSDIEYRLRESIDLYTDRVIELCGDLVNHYTSPSEFAKEMNSEKDNLISKINETIFKKEDK